MNPTSAEPQLSACAPWGAAALLAACGGGGSGSQADADRAEGGSALLAVALTDEDAARLLAQAAFGATDPHIERVKALGARAWLDEQFATPRTEGHYSTMLGQGLAVEANLNGFNGFENTVWRKLIASPDVLRQRMVLALSEIFVVSMQGLPVPWRGFVMAAYVDLLETHAFGNYRQLLEAVTLSPAMGVYLNMRGNRKANAATGRVPDENYAREVLQLFSVGLVELNLDGSARLDGRGQPQETYSQETITGLARVFTGWDYDRFVRTDPGHAQRPMVVNIANHESAEKQFLGTTVPANTAPAQGLAMALDAIAQHPNVGPFMGRQLIQRLVCSHPSAAYVSRVAAVFNNNGLGVRGDLQALLRAVLLDPEARRAPADGQNSRGMLREPVVRFVQWARTFGVTSPTGLWNVGNLSDPATRLGQSPFRAPSVFNFFRPGYVPPNSALGEQGITAPEFQITNESTVVGWANFAQSFVASGVAELRANYSAELALASDAPALVRRVALLLAANALSQDTLALITQAVNSISAATAAGRNNRVYAAVHLVLCAPEYLVQI